MAGKLEAAARFVALYRIVAVSRRFLLREGRGRKRQALVVAEPR